MHIFIYSRHIGRGEHVEAGKQAKLLLPVAQPAAISHLFPFPQTPTTANTTNDSQRKGRGISVWEYIARPTYLTF